jgi:hypothetical protein
MQEITSPPKSCIGSSGRHFCFPLFSCGTQNRARKGCRQPIFLQQFLRTPLRDEEGNSRKIVRCKKVDRCLQYFGIKVFDQFFFRR